MKTNLKTNTSQVARSVGVAEQLGAAKAEAEFEAGQLRSQVKSWSVGQKEILQIGRSVEESVSQSKAEFEAGQLRRRPSVGQSFSQSQCVSQLIRDRARTMVKEQSRQENLQVYQSDHQVERQQGRIRGLIEEQCAKVEEERAGMERR